MLQAPASRVAAATRRLCFATIFLTNAASAATRQNEMSKLAPGAERWPGFLLRRAVARAAEISWALQASADRLFLLLKQCRRRAAFSLPQRHENDAATRIDEFDRGRPRHRRGRLVRGVAGLH